MKFFFVPLILIHLFSGVYYAQTAHLPTERQSWNEFQLIIPLIQGKDSKKKTVDKITMTMTGNLRIGRRSFDFLDNRIGVTLDFRINKYLSVLSGALYRRDEIVKGVRRYETRFDAGATLSKTWHGLAIRDRNMFEHRFRNFRRDTNLYRNRIQISYPIKIKEKEWFSPFISEEGYYDLGSHAWATNEFFAGISRKLNKRITAEFAYVHNDSQPINVDGFSFGLRIKLR